MPTLSLSELSARELGELRATVREVAEAAGGPAMARRLESAVDGADFDRESWKTLAQDVGLAGLGLPADAGGVGGLVELLAVAEELGAALTAVPFLSSTVLTGQVLARCGPSAVETLKRVASGQIGTVALVDAAGRFDPAGVVSGTLRSGSDVTLDGQVRFVTDGLSAEILVVSVAGEHGCDVAVVDPVSRGVTRRPMRVLDFSRPQAEITFTGTPATLLTTGGTGLAALRGGLDVALLALAADQLGGAQRAFDRTLDYVKARRQFNREIGSFQAVKHRLADALALVEQARSAVDRVGWRALDEQALAEASVVASCWCSDAYVAVTAEMVHLHGGIGFTWEHDAHLYFRRARADAVLWGDATYHRERLATLRGW